MPKKLLVIGLIINLIMVVSLVLVAKTLDNVFVSIAAACLIIIIGVDGVKGINLYFGKGKKQDIYPHYGD
jgi:hypothetical protein